MKSRQMQPFSCALYLHRALERDTHTGKRDSSGRQEDKLDRFTKNKDSKMLKVSAEEQIVFERLREIRLM